MLGRTHALGGQVAWLVTAPLLPPLGLPAPWYVTAGGLLFATWGAYGPDMDHASATWARSFWGGPAVSRLVARAVGGHRMGTHSLLSVPVAFLAVWGALVLARLALAAPEEQWPILWCFVLAIAFAVGWGSHLLLDGLTIKGIGLLYPFSRRRYRWGVLKTSKNSRRLNRGETWVTRLLFVVGALQVVHLILGGFIVQT